MPVIHMENQKLWFVIHTYSGFEKKVKDSLEQRVKAFSMQESFGSILIPEEEVYEIKAGKLGRLLQNCTYTGMTPQFWGSCDAVCNQDHWEVWGTPNCGKGQPSQIAHTGHGAAPARFRNVRVGVLQ